MTSPERRYISYLLRLWRVSRTGKPVWRASLESPLTGQRLAFANLADLFAFLESETGRSSQDQDEAGAQNNTRS
jgi:hypothetical protein